MSTLAGGWGMGAVPLRSESRAGSIVRKETGAIGERHQCQWKQKTFEKSRINCKSARPYGRQTKKTAQTLFVFQK